LGGQGYEPCAALCLLHVDLPRRIGFFEYLFHFVMDTDDELAILGLTVYQGYDHRELTALWVMQGSLNAL